MSVTSMFGAFSQGNGCPRVSRDFSPRGSSSGSTRPRARWVGLGNASSLGLPSAAAFVVKSAPKRSRAGRNGFARKQAEPLAGVSGCSSRTFGSTRLVGRVTLVLPRCAQSSGSWTLGYGGVCGVTSRNNGAAGAIESYAAGESAVTWLGALPSPLMVRGV